MATNNCPVYVSNFALVYEVEILSMIARWDDLVPGLEKITEEIVVSQNIWILPFAFWDLVWFTRDPKDEPCLGRC